VSITTYAKESIRDIAPYVMSVAVSDISGEGKMYLNITTKEGQQFTVELTSLGFQVVGYMLNSRDVADQPIYETPAALLNTISTEYTRAFANHLIDKLETLAEDQFILSLTNCQLGGD
jgi:DNA primase